MPVVHVLRGAQFVAQVDEKTEACGPEEARGRLCELIYDLSDNVDAAQVADDVSQPVTAFLILVVAWIASRVVRWMIGRFVEHIASAGGDDPRTSMLAKARDTGFALVSVSPDERSAQRAQTIGAVLRSVATFTIWTIAFFLVLGTFGVDIGPLLAGAGFLGIAFGFGAQKLIQDFTSGLFMIIEDQFGVGDVIDVGDTSGTVEGLSLRTTKVRDVEGVLWFVPNGEIRRVANKSQKWARAVLDIDVAYDTDLGRAQSVILDAAMAMYDDPEWGGDEILEPPEVWGVQALGSDAVSIRLVVKTAPLEQWLVGRELRRRVKDALDASGIEIPFPQRTVWIRADDSVADVAVPTSVEDGGGATRHTGPGPELDSGDTG